MERSRSRGTERVVLLVLAEAVNEKQVAAGGPWDAWPSKDRIAARANLQPDKHGKQKRVQECLRSLSAIGEIVWTGETVGKGIRVYRLTLPDQMPISEGLGVDIATPKGVDGATPGGGQSNPKGVDIATPEPEGTGIRTGREEPDTTRRFAPAAAATVPDDLPYYDEKRIDAIEFLDGEAMVAALNEMREKRSGKPVMPWRFLTPSGKLSPHGRAIIGCLGEFPGYDVDQFISYARKCFEGDPSPPWWKGEEPQSAGAVFGKRIFYSVLKYTPGEEWTEPEPDPDGIPAF
jgi:hypothetical protein